MAKHLDLIIQEYDRWIQKRLARFFASKRDKHGGIDHLLEYLMKLYALFKEDPIEGDDAFNFLVIGVSR